MHPQKEEPRGPLTHLQSMWLLECLLHIAVPREKMLFKMVPPCKKTEEAEAVSSPFPGHMPSLPQRLKLSFFAGILAEVPAGVGVVCWPHLCLCPRVL